MSSNLSVCIASSQTDETKPTINLKLKHFTNVAYWIKNVLKRVTE